MGVALGERETVNERQFTAIRQQRKLTTLLFAVTAFVGASLLFVVQPMVARMVLPLYGGSATVWSTSSLFFQVLLLLGYLYAHVATTRLRPVRQLWLHAGVLLLPVVALPIVLPVDAAPSNGVPPALWLLRTLAIVIGLPFAVVSTTGPLLQRWYSWTRGPRADDPYFLFAAGNLGSFGGLLAYPLAIEPLLSLDQQRIAWSCGFGSFVVLLGSCALVTSRIRPSQRPAPAEARELLAPASCRTPPSRKQYAAWFALATLPSSLMLGVTAHISTDIAAIPLMWVAPLALYLATFVVAFARTTRVVSALAARAAVALSALSCVAIYAKNDVPTVFLILLALTTLTAVAYLAHSRLAATRPDTDHLTAFYLVVAAGGATGGLLNGLVAPAVLDRVWEYPAALVASTLLAVGVGNHVNGALERRYGRRFAAVLRVVLLVSVSIMTILLAAQGQRLGYAWAGLCGVLLLAVLVDSAKRPLTVGVSMVLLVATAFVAVEDGDIENSRTFYGTYRVEDENGAHVLAHGTTIHGMQFQGARSHEPTTYYSRSGPLGDVFNHSGMKAARVGVVGLGTGTVAAYGSPNQSMTFFEIDPEMVRIAQDTTLFTYLADSEADVHVVTGDGRLRVQKAPPGTFDLLILDAFSSDAIPVHLLTREAFRIYADRLAAGGILAVHISTRVFDLEPVVADAAKALGYSAAFGTGVADGSGAADSAWVVLSADPTAIEAISADNKWRPITKKRVTWTDDYSSVLTVLRGLPRQ